MKSIREQYKACDYRLTVHSSRNRYDQRNRKHRAEGLFSCKGSRQRMPLQEARPAAIADNVRSERHENIERNAAAGVLGDPKGVTRRRQQHVVQRRSRKLRGCGGAPRPSSGVANVQRPQQASVLTQSRSTPTCQASPNSVHQDRHQSTDAEKGQAGQGDNNPRRYDNQRSPPPPSERMTQEERQARIDGHVVSPVTTSARVLQMKQKLAELDGETLPDFEANALVAIPVQAGGLHPISDLGYIKREIDEPTTLRRHIAQLAREIAASVSAPGEFVAVEGGVGFRYRHPEDELEVTATALHTLTLLQSLSGSIAIALHMIQEQPALQVGALADFEFAAGLGQILMGQPLTNNQHPDDSGRLSDGALVKLFRIVRLARRLIDLEIRAFDETTPPTDS